MTGVVRRRLFGATFLLVLAALVAASALRYAGVLTPSVTVTLRGEHLGAHLAGGADVKLRGVRVGAVRSVTTDGSTMSVALALDPSAVGAVPADVMARLLPKTLFGEVFVELVPRSGTAAGPIRAGAVIAQDRSRAALSLERVLDDLIPLLRAVEPGRLQAVLTTLAGALDGRGERLGEGLVRLEHYLRVLNAELPTIRADLAGLADAAGAYADAAPDLLSVLRDLATVGTGIAHQRAQLAAFTASTTRFAETATELVAENQGRMIRLAEVSRPTLAALARYAPEYGCLLRGLSDFAPRADEVFGARGLHVTLEVAGDQRRYEPGRDELRYGARSGPNCHGLPAPENTSGGSGGAGSTGGAGGHGAGAAMGYAGSAEERTVVRAALAPVLGRPADSVPGVSALLFGPLARGTTVRVG